jgi:hypothetical protein
MMLFTDEPLWLGVWQGSIGGLWFRCGSLCEGEKSVWKNEGNQWISPVRRQVVNAEKNVI